MMCPIACGMSVKFKDGSHEGTGHIMCVECNAEPEEMAVNNENFGHAAFVRLKEMDKMGYSVWAMHLDIWPLFTYGVLTPEDMGIDAPVGSVEFSRELIRKISYREGLGDELAKGRAHFLNEFVGTSEAQLMYQMQAVTQGQSRLTYNYGANFYGPIGWLGSCVERGRNNDLTWAFSNTITDPRVVVQGSAAYDELQERVSEWLWGSPQAAIDSKMRVMSEYTAMQAYTAHNYKAWCDSLGTCTNFQPHISMYSDDYLGSWDIRRNLYTAASASRSRPKRTRSSPATVSGCSERCLGVRQGQTKEDDWLFDCIFEDDSYKSFGLTREGLRQGIDQYYEMRGIDVETGLPRRSALEALGLAEVADRLENEYHIALPAGAVEPALQSSWEPRRCSRRLMCRPARSPPGALRPRTRLIEAEPAAALPGGSCTPVHTASRRLAAENPL